MKAYYAARAPRYEAVYDRPESADERGELTTDLRAWARGRAVYEVACGTGFWSRRIADVVASLDPTDGTPEVVEEARRNAVPARVADAWSPAPAGGAVLAMFWFSHLRKVERAAWLAAMGSGPIFLADNLPVPGLGGETFERDGDLWKRREEAGRTWEIVKNYPTEEELRDLFPGAELRRGALYWWVRRG